MELSRTPRDRQGLLTQTSAFLQRARRRGDRNEQLIGALAQLGEMGREVDDEQRALDQTLRQLDTLLDADLLLALCWTDGCYTVRATHGQHDPGDLRGWKVPTGSFPRVDETLAKGRARNFVRGDHRDPFKAQLPEGLTRCCLVLPLRALGEQVGAVIAYSAQPGALDRSDARLAEAYMAAAGHSLYTARVNHELTVLDGLLREMSQTRDLTQAMAALAERGGGLVPGGIFALAIAGPDGRVANEMRADTRAGREKLARSRRPLEGSALATAFAGTATGKVIKLQPSRANDAEIESYVALGLTELRRFPIAIDGRVAAVLSVATPPASRFSDRHRRHVARVADVLGLGLERFHLASARRQVQSADSAPATSAESSFDPRVLACTHSMTRSILGMSRTMLHDPDLPAEERNHFLRHVVDEVERLGSVLEAVQLLNDIEQRRRPDPTLRELVDVSALFDRAAAACDDSLAMRGQTLRYDAPERLRIEGDPELLQRALCELLRNACDASPEGALIDLIAWTDDAGLHISVTDAGPGIPEAYRALACERFFRLPDAAPGTGLGLGLAVVNAVAEAHDMSLQMREAEGGGFEVELGVPRALLVA